MLNKKYHFIEQRAGVFSGTMPGADSQELIGERNGKGSISFF
jgi:hypothetical protein